MELDKTDPNAPPDVNNLQKPINTLRGDDLPVSAFVPGGW